ncbi:Hypothetical predicted protein [Cloeon dipterum]|uniref:Cytochrome P450 n=2 Tax=Cloeon dipterum TaxID=197152 RepID=A0A8S1CW51_9INSE|nr:Hypothetical predicted protein [Cloeon dipterum]
MLLEVVFCLLLFFWAVKRASRGPPGPWGLPLLGYLPFIDPVKPYVSLANLAQRYDAGIYGISLGNVKTVVLTDAKLIRHALNREECAGRAPLYLTHGIMNGYGIICAEGIRWKEHRRFITSALKSMGMVKIGGSRDLLGKRVMEGADQFVKIIKEKFAQGEDAIDPAPLLSHTLGSLVYDIVFGKRYERDDETWVWLQHLQEEGTKLIGVAGPLNFLPWFRFIPKFRDSIKFLIDGKNKTHDLYREQLKFYMDSGLMGGDTHLAGAYLKEVKERTKTGNVSTFTEPQVLHALADIFGASLDTTNATLKWFLLFMALHPEVQSIVKAELDEAALARDERNPRMSDLSCCPYTEAAISETQRLRSVVPTGIPHGAIQDVEIGGYIIEAGTMIMPLQWAVHTDPKLWGNDVMQFNPERFLNSDGRISKPEYFIPFQTGKRVCLGEELGRMLIFAFASAVIFNFSVSVAGDEDVESVLEGDCGITLNPKAHKLIFKPHLPI